MNVDREDIHIISRHSNWAEDGVHKALNEKVYAPASDWKKFLKIFFITLGVSFIVSGIIFFFAYNWANLHKFMKIGMMEGLIVVTTLVLLFTKINPLVKNIMLTGAAVLVGVLFAVFGQIYQTGANAYDFFLGWTVFITLWALATNFAPLWLIYLTLVNTTIILYADQVAHDWSGTLTDMILFLINTLAVIISVGLPAVKPDLKKPPHWFIVVLVLTSVTYATVGIMDGIFSYRSDTSFPILLVLTGAAYASGIRHGFKEKSIFYLSVIPFSIIIIVCSAIIDTIENEGGFLLISLFAVASVSFLIKYLFDLQKKWADE